MIEKLESWDHFADHNVLSSSFNLSSSPPGRQAVVAFVSDELWIFILRSRSISNHSRSTSDHIDLWLFLLALFSWNKEVDHLLCTIYGKKISSAERKRKSFSGKADYLKIRKRSLLSEDRQRFVLFFFFFHYSHHKYLSTIDISNRIPFDETGHFLIPCGSQ